VLAGRVHFTGYVPGAEVRSWFEIADAVVLPYRRIDQSMVSSVAAATRTPVLLSRVGGLAEGAPDRWTFPPRDPRAMARVITDFLAAHAAGETPDTGAPSPTLEAFTESTLDVYEDVRGAVPAGVTG
jgi:glycosyltransferase involved in cell wall biosynthesis